MQSTSSVSWRMSIPVLHRLLLFLSAAVVVAGFTAAALAPPQGPSDTLPRWFTLFLMDLEKNVPTYLSVGLLMLGSLAFFLTGVLRSAVHHKERLMWNILAAGFAFMALDERFGIHERLIRPVRRLARDLSASSELGIFFYAWVLVALPLVALLSIYLLPRVFRLPPRLRNGLILAGAVYLMGSIGMEMVGGAYREGNPIKDPTYWFITTVEETLEISGLLILISVLLRNLRESLHVTDVSVGVLIDPRPQPDPRAPVPLDAHGIAASSRAG